MIDDIKTYMKLLYYVESNKYIVYFDNDVIFAII